MSRPVADRFWEKVERTDSCWLWTSAKDKDGYPLFQLLSTKTVRGHRWVWEQVNGSIPAGLLVCHHCDNPPCVRPDHLFLGTPRCNNEDRNEKGRQSQGENHYAAKLTRAQVDEMRARKAAGESIYGFYAQYGVSYSAAKEAVTGKRKWKAA